MVKPGFEERRGGAGCAAEKGESFLAVRHSLTPLISAKEGVN